MTLEQQVADTIKAVGEFKTSHNQMTAELKDRLKDLEQRSVGGFPRASDDARPGLFAKSVTDSEQYRAMVSGNGHRVKIALPSQALAMKNTIVGTSGTPAVPDGVLAQAERQAGVVAGAFRQLRVRQLFPTLPTASNMVEFTRETAFVNNAAVQQGEGAQKPESDITFNVLQARVATIAHTIKVSKQSLDDQAALELFLNTRMVYGVQLAEEAQLLAGDGVGQNLSGILTAGQHSDYSRAQTGDTRIDTVRRAITQLELADWMATGVVMNPADWEAVALQKDQEEGYLFADPSEWTQPMIWGLPVVPSNSLAAGQFIVADFQSAGVLFDRQTPTVEMFEEDEDNVQKNLVTIRAENRVALAITRPDAVIVGAFA